METLEIPKALRDAESLAEYKELRNRDRKSGETPAEIVEPKDDKPKEPQADPKPKETDSKEETAGKSAAPETNSPEVKEEPKATAPPAPVKSKARNAIERARELISQGRDEEAERVLAGSHERRENDRLERLERELQEMRTRKPAQETQPHTPVNPPVQQSNNGARAPLPTDPEFQKENGFLEFLTAKAIYEIEQRNRTREESTRQASENQTRQENLARLNWKAQEARSKFPDFDQVTYADPQHRTGFLLTAPMQEYFLQSDDPMEVMYHLAKDRAEYQRIYALPPARQLAELGKYEDRITARQSAPAPTSTQATPRPAPVSRVAPPPRHLAGTEAASPQDHRDPTIGFAEYKKRRGR